MKIAHCLINNTDKPIECKNKKCPMRIPCLYGGRPATLPTSLSEILAGAHVATKNKLVEFDYAAAELQIATQRESEWTKKLSAE